MGLKTLISHIDIPQLWRRVFMEVPKWMHIAIISLRIDLKLFRKLRQSVNKFVEIPLFLYMLKRTFYVRRIIVIPTNIFYRHDTTFAAMLCSSHQILNNIFNFDAVLKSHFKCIFTIDCDLQSSDLQYKFWWIKLRPQGKAILNRYIEYFYMIKELW